MFCKNCRRELPNGAVACPYCGTRTGRGGNGDKRSAGYAVLGFIFPIVGLILYLVWKEDYPLRAKSAGKGALISVILSAVLVVLYFLLIGGVIGAIFL